MRSQGIATIEPDEETGGFIVLLPDGRVEHRESARSAEALCIGWAGRDVRAHGGPGLLTIYWRGGAKPTRVHTTPVRSRATATTRTRRRELGL